MKLPGNLRLYATAFDRRIECRLAADGTVVFAGGDVSKSVPLFVEWRAGPSQERGPRRAAKKIAAQLRERGYTVQVLRLDPAHPAPGGTNR